MDLTRFLESPEKPDLSLDDLQQLLNCIDSADPRAAEPVFADMLAQLKLMELEENQRIELASSDLATAKQEYERALHSVDTGLKSLVQVRNLSARQKDASTATQASLRKQCSQLTGQIDAAMEEKITALQLCAELEADDATSQAEWDRSQVLFSASCGRAMQHLHHLRARAADLCACIKEVQPRPTFPDPSNRL